MKYKIIVLMLSLLALMSNMAFAESINVTFTDPERNAFVNKTISLEIDKYNRIVLPKTFAETVNVNIPSSQKVDDETYYFDSDWETNESSYPYSFTGWQILGTATRIPSVTTYHAGDYIDFEFLAEDPNTESINKNSLIMTACWGKTVFVRNKYNTMKYNKYGIFEDEISSQSGATGADDANSGRKVTEPKASMPEAYRLFDTDNTDYDAYKNVVMLVGNLDYIKPNSTSSNQPGYSTVYAHAYWGYLTNMGSVANNVRNATMKSLLTLSTVPNLKMKAFNWTTTFNGSIIFDNVDMSVAKEADFIDFNKSLLYLSHGMQINNHKMYIALSNRAKNTQRSGFTFYASANYNIVNGGYISSYIYSSGGGWNAKPTYLVGINGEVGTMYLGTTNGNFAQDHASEIHYYGNGGMVGNLFGSSEASNHITKKDRYITSKTQTITNLYGGGAAAPLYGSTNLDIKGCNITSLYGGGRDFTANIYGDIHINVEDSTINSIFCGGKNGNVMKVPEDAPYGVVGTGGHIYFDLKNSTIANDIFGSGSGGSQTISVSNYKAYPVNSDYWESDEWAKPFSDYPKYDP